MVNIYFILNLFIKLWNYNSLGLILILLLIFMIIFYNKFIGRNIHHIELYLENNLCKKFIFLVIIFMIILVYLKSYFGKYQYVANWLQSISLIGVLIQVIQWKRHNKRILDNKISWVSIPHYNETNNKYDLNRPIVSLKNLSGKNIHNLKIYLNILNVKSAEDSPNSVKNDSKITRAGLKAGIRSVSMGISWSQKDITYKLKDRYNSIIPSITYAYLYNSFKRCMPYSFGKYTFVFNFYCPKNYQSQNMKVLYNYQDSEKKSKVLNIIKS